MRSLTWLAALALVALLAYLYAPPVGAVSPETLQYSIEREAGGTHSGASCENATAGRWVCHVDDPDPRRGAVAYVLVRHGRRCWDASHQSTRPTSLPVNVSGCAALKDQVRLFNRV